jgi:hypothetical protein
LPSSFFVTLISLANGMGRLIMNFISSSYLINYV